VSSLPSDNANNSSSPAWMHSWRHKSTWLYLVMLLASAVALLASLVLSADTLYSARHPAAHLGCDINNVISCSTVAQSWQAEIVHLGRLTVPNAFIGMAAESVFVTVAVVGLCNPRMPRWFPIATWWGDCTALLYSYWLTTQSLFVINALCPWCITLMFSTTIQFMSLTHATVTVQGIPRTDTKFRKFLDSIYRPGLDIMIDVIWIVLLVIIILLRDGSRIFA
jgi:uncharacterized membrane protein